MTGTIDLKDVTVIYEDKLPKTGEAYQAIYLNEKTIDQMVDLQDAVQAVLPEDQKGFLLPRTRETFEKYLANGNILTGIVVNGRLVAQGAMNLPTAENPETGIDAKLNVPPGKIAVLQGVMVDPAVRGNSLMLAIGNLQFRLARTLGRPHIQAAVDVRNRYSASTALGTGFEAYTISHKVLKPGIETTVYGMYAPLERLENRGQRAFEEATGKSKATPVLSADVEGQERMLEQGYKVTYYDRSSEGKDKDVVYFTKIDPQQDIVITADNRDRIAAARAAAAVREAAASAKTRELAAEVQAATEKVVFVPVDMAGKNVYDRIKLAPKNKSAQSKAYGAG